MFEKNYYTVTIKITGKKKRGKSIYVEEKIGASLVELKNSGCIKILTFMEELKKEQEERAERLGNIKLPSASFSDSIYPIVEIETFRVIWDSLECTTLKDYSKASVQECMNDLTMEQFKMFKKSLK